MSTRSTRHVAVLLSVPFGPAEDWCSLRFSQLLEMATLAIVGFVGYRAIGTGVITELSVTRFGIVLTAVVGALVFGKTRGQTLSLDQRRILCGMIVLACALAELLSSSIEGGFWSLLLLAVAWRMLTIRRVKPS